MKEKNNFDALEEAVRKNGGTMERLQESIRPALEKQEELRSIVESVTVVMPTVAVQPSIVTALTQVANNNALNNYRESIQIYVALKHMGNVTKKVKEYPFVLGRTPHTFRELIEESVKSCIDAYKTRATNAKDPAPLTDEQFDGMREIGKFAFGVHYNENDVDEAKAIQTAIDAVQDGLVRVFKDNVEITDLDAEIEISEGDVFTFVRLTMLSGRMW